MCVLQKRSACNFPREKGNLPFPDIKTRSPAEILCVKTLLSLPDVAKRSSILYPVHLRKSLWGTQYLCHSSLQATRPKVMRGVQAVFEFSSGIKRQNGNRTDWIELSSKIIYWQSGLHGWVKREIAKRKKKTKKQTFWAIYFGFWIVFQLLDEANNAPKEAFLPLLIWDYRSAWNTWKCINCSLITS